MRPGETMETTDPTPRLSVVVPFYNEEDVAAFVVDEIGRELTAFGASWEAILVDDGSTDRTAERLAAAQQRWPGCRLLRLPKNVGQGPALFEGIRRARAPIIATMDGDGQNLPGDIPVLLACLDRADLVVGVRTDRCDSRMRRGLSLLANAVRSRLLRDGVRDAGCALKVFRREVVGVLRPMPMLNPFMPALAVAAGFKVAEHPVRHRARMGGRSKYGGTALLFRPAGQLLSVWWVLRHARKAGNFPANAARRS